MAKIIYITGASGSGTSTLGSAIQSCFDVNLIESDDITMLPTEPPFQFPRPTEERLPILIQKIQKDKVNVIVGSINDWGNQVIAEADMFILLYADFDIREKRIRQRELKRFGRRLTEDAVISRNYKRLIAWTRDYDTFYDCRSLKHHKELYDNFKKDKFIFENQEISDILSLIKPKIKKLIEG